MRTMQHCSQDHFGLPLGLFFLFYFTKPVPLDYHFVSGCDLRGQRRTMYVMRASSALLCGMCS